MEERLGRRLLLKALDRYCLRIASFATFYQGVELRPKRCVKYFLCLLQIICGFIDIFGYIRVDFA